MTKTVYLVCGVSGSGKSWVCRQLDSKFTYIPHDEHYKDFEATIIAEAKRSHRPMISEVPFGERLVREKLEAAGLKVVPVFVVEQADLVAKRFAEREKRPLPKNVYTRASTIMNRVKEWQAPHGTSKQMLEYLRDLDIQEKKEGAA